MKSTLLALSIAMFFSCQSQRNSASKMASVIEDVYFQNWMSGVRGGGAGIHFHVLLKSPLPAGTKLHTVLFKGKQAEFRQQDSLHYVATIPTKIGARPDPEKEESATPLPESTRAELYFVTGGKSAVHILENVREKEMLAYPVMNKPSE